jgi:hypothetical protein
MITSSFPTIYGQKLALLKNFNLTFTADSGTTLNEKWGIPYASPPTPNPAVPATLYPTLGYLAIGNGGQQSVFGSSFTAQLVHTCDDAALASQIPWLVVPANADLSLAEQANYRLRIPATIGGVPSVCYYLKVITWAPMSVEFTTFTVASNAITNQATFTPSSANQTPNMITASSVRTNIASGHHISTTIPTSIAITQADVTGIINACTLLYGDANTAVINEAAIVSGFDVTSSYVYGGSTVTYTEIQCAQIVNFLTLNQNLNANPSLAFDINMSIGSTQPLFTSNS